MPNGDDNNNNNPMGNIWSSITLDEDFSIDWGSMAEGWHRSIQASNLGTEALPSLPSISNIGSVPFTGAVNWNSVPAGFQPLPQTISGKKKLYQLSQFHGGLNLKSSPRDIADNECQVAENVTVSDVGRVKLLGDWQNVNNGITAIGDTPTNRGTAGYGLFQFTSPAATDGTVGEHVITLTANGDTIDAYNVIADSTTQVTAFIDYAGTSDNDDVAQIMYAAGSGVYVNDANFAHTSANNPRKAKVYVDRPDFNGNQITRGWADDVDSGGSFGGKALIDSPTYYGNEAAGKVYLNNSDAAADADIAFTVASTAGATVVHIGTDGDVPGTWNGYYTFYISWLFDNGCETGLTSLHESIALNSESLYFNFSCKSKWNAGEYPGTLTNCTHIGLDSDGTYTMGEPRINGARIYFKAKTGGYSSVDVERFLLAEISLVDGGKGALDSTFTPWTESSDVFHIGADINDSAFKFVDPPTVYSYSSLNGYYANETYSMSPNAVGTTPTALNVRYKTAVIGQKGIIYIGNVKFNTKHMPDSMMFSMPGKPGVFPLYNTFDSPSSDGSPITALAAFQDTILQFRSNGLYVINVSNPGQPYAEAAFRDCGIANPCQAFTTAFGVIFANPHGCFIYDGQKVISLTGGKFDISTTGTKNWYLPEASAVNALGATDKDAAQVPCVGYDPRSQNIIVLKGIGDDDTSDDAWVYNMVTQSWTEGKDMIDNADNIRHTNPIITSAGFLSILKTTVGTITNYNHDKVLDTGQQDISYVTKDIDFGVPSQTKKIFKIYVTYLGDGSSVTVTYGANGDTSPTEALTNSENSSTTLTNAGTTDHNVATLTLDSHPSDLKSIALKFDGTAGSSFEINDISILYRLRPVK